MFETDGHEYDIVKNAVANTWNDGLFLEIGTRLGGSTKIIIDEILKKHSGTDLITIDPYGDIPYETKDGVWCRYDYDNSMRKQAYKDLFDYTFEKDINLYMLTLTDQQYMARYHDGYPVYREREDVRDKYAFVYFDGPHSSHSVLAETMFFTLRGTDNCILVYDDVGEYNHSIVHDYLIANYWEAIETGKFKISYRRIP